MFGSDSDVIRIDMSEYMEKQSTAKLIGAPPGYAGYDEGGYLTEKVHRKPYSVVLFDEIEKAHGDVFNILLQILEDGIVTDSQGRTVSFKNTIIIMTSNLGSSLILENRNKADENALKESLSIELRRHFRPEFLNRIDETLIFHSLGKAEIRNIVDLQLKQLSARLQDNGISMQIDDAAKDLLAEAGYDPDFGARPLKRAIIQLVETPVSKMMIAGNISAGQKLQISVKDGKLDFSAAE